jgi:ATP-dependent DNA helicase DinG
VVAAFGYLVAPYDRWTLALRAVSPAGSFHREFLEARESFAAVSASLFVGGDAFAALGELELEERSAFGTSRLAVPSPFDYASHMRVVALPDPVGTDGLVAETAAAIATLARCLGGRTMGLFTSLRRLRDVAERLSLELGPAGIEVVWPRRAADDPVALIRRFRTSPGGAVLLGSRSFWQGVDIPGDDLQAVVIEKLPFEVPTELRRRREARIAELGVNAFERYRLGKMLLHLKQMTGRLIRGEDDRGVVVIVEPRSSRRYASRLADAFPDGTTIVPARVRDLPAIVSEVQRGVALTPDDSES